MLFSVGCLGGLQAFNVGLGVVIVMMLDMRADLDFLTGVHYGNGRRQHHRDSKVDCVLLGVEGVGWGHRLSINISHVARWWGR